MSSLTLAEAADQLAIELRRHATVSATDPSNVAEIVRQGEVLRKAMLAYERVLGYTTGWSNPLRHLDDEAEDRLHGMIENTEPRSTHSEAQRVHVNARYYLRVDDPVAIRSYVRARLGYEPSNIVDVVRRIYEADAWKLDKYPKGLLTVEDIGVDAYVEE